MISAVADTIATFAQSLVSVVFTAVPVAGIEINLIVVWLAAAMLFFTVRLGFINVRAFGLAVALVRGRHREDDGPGEISHFQALATALSGTVGLGNVAGVAIAIATGGPGAAFWMVLLGFFAMSLKCAEVTLGVKYRRTLDDGHVSGGPMWTLRYGLAEIGLPRLGRLLGVVYAVFALFAFMQIIQVNQSYAQLRIVLDLGDDLRPALAYGVIIAVLSALVLIGGVRSLARVTSAIVPFMCVLYLVGVVIVLGINADRILPALSLIVHDAFAPQAVAGGIVGSFVAGMRRAVFSNEAGIGTAAIAHAPVRTREPASEGIVALLEPFVDTIVLCSATALVIVVTGAWQGGEQDIAMASAAFGTVASWFPAVLAVVVCLFAFSTILAVGYYGLQVWGFLVGFAPWKERLYLAAFCGCLPFGAIIDVTTVVNLVDSFFFLLSVPNLIGLYLLSGVVRRECDAYFRKTR